MLTLSGKNTILAANYFPAIDLRDGGYEFSLAIFETSHNTERNRTINFISPKTTRKLQFSREIRMKCET